MPTPNIVVSAVISFRNASMTQACTPAPNKNLVFFTHTNLAKQMIDVRFAPLATRMLRCRERSDVPRGGIARWFENE
jgi:hypothetical protein